ncbi:hypothetical protein [Actinoalloteichus caeruleus]|uniref:Uncharacterized protein n=1 Tax=Actinoalloteichus caeruleus DSM 43889 TaxID=1120930 RepID=A0ABT1JPT0_ACTCY|nr:hypothetical protein [Actinoalloteichus caeruleus]MCP2334367.1 hypothetical protein [Actinoalloteichus caeruleus DSM 43889]
MLPEDDRFEPIGDPHFDRLVGETRSAAVAGHLLDWLALAHSAAAELQRVRRRSARGSWANGWSFGTDRYQYLLATASGLPDARVNPAFQSMTIGIGNCALYQYRAKTGSPLTSVLDDTELQRRLVRPPEEPPGLFPANHAITGGRDLLFLPWTGSEAAGLSGAWVGQGSADRDYRIRWSWLWPLTSFTRGYARTAGLGGPLTARPAPTGTTGWNPHDLPELPLRHRARPQEGTSGT